MSWFAFVVMQNLISTFILDGFILSAPFPNQKRTQSGWFLQMSVKTTTAAKIIQRVSLTIKVKHFLIITSCRQHYIATQYTRCLCRSTEGLGGGKYSCRFQLPLHSSSVCWSSRHCQSPNTVPRGRRRRRRALPHTWKEHIRVSSTLIMPPALSNSPQ